MNFGNDYGYDASQDPYSMERDKARQRLASAYMGANKAQGDLMGHQRDEQNLTWGGDVARGAMLGSIVPGYGTAIGAGVGLISGLGRAMATRQKHGEGFLSSLGNSLKDTFSSRGLGALLSSPSAVPAAAGIGRALAPTPQPGANTPDEWQAAALTNNDLDRSNQLTSKVFSDSNASASYGDYDEALRRRNMAAV